MRKLVASVFAMLTRLLVGTGISRLPLVHRTYQFLYRLLIGTSVSLPPLLINVQGQQMYVDATSVSFAPARVRSRAYEEQETELFKKIVRGGMVVVDIGANIGYYTLIAASIVGEHGKVFAFEPEPKNHALLVKNIEANGYENIIAVPKAVSDKGGSTRLFLSPDGNTGWHRIYDSEDGWNSIEIETVTLDEFFQGKEESIDVIKMDVEGSEMAVLQGMTRILERNDKLIIFTEFFPALLKKSGASPEGYLNELEKHGFKLYKIGEPMRLIDTDDIGRLSAIEQHANLVCLRGEGQESLLAEYLGKDN